MSQDSQAAIVEAPSMLLAFIHDEPTLPERLAFGEGVKQSDRQRLKKMEKDISQLVEAVKPELGMRAGQRRARI